MTRIPCVRGLLVSLVAASCVTQSNPATQPPTPLSVSGSAQDLKDRAVHAAIAEINLGSGGQSLRYGVYLDSLVGPTPKPYLHEHAHPSAWLKRLVDDHVIDGIYSVPDTRSQLPLVVFAIEVGEPYPLKGDTAEILYDWKVRRIPAVPDPSCGHGWRDTYVFADTGWAHINHTTFVSMATCGP